MTRIMIFTTTWSKYSYNLKANTYPIELNNINPIYDTFISLRDTFQKSWKYFNGKEWSKLVIGEGWETVEVIWKNLSNTRINPWYTTNPDLNIINTTTWPYLVYLPASDEESDIPLAATYGTLSYRITKDWNFEIKHKCQLQNISWKSKILSYINHYVYQPVSQTYLSPNKIAVYQLEWAVLQDIDSISCVWYINKNLSVNDILVWRIEDENGDLLDWNMLQYDSNYLEITCTWLPLT